VKIQGKMITYYFIKEYNLPINGYIKKYYEKLIYSAPDSVIIASEF